MSRRDRRDGDRRPGERRESQFDDEQQRRPDDQPSPQESDSLTALKAILAKVAALLEPLKLTQDESIRLVEQFYGSVLETDVKLAGETDDMRKSSVLAHIQNASVTRGSDNKIVVEYPVVETPPAKPAPPPAGESPTAVEEAPPPGAQSESGGSGSAKIDAAAGDSSAPGADASRANARKPSGGPRKTSPREAAREPKDTAEQGSTPPSAEEPPA